MNIIVLLAVILRCLKHHFFESESFLRFPLARNSPESHISGIELRVVWMLLVVQRSFLQRSSSVKEHHQKKLTYECTSRSVLNRTDCIRRSAVPLPFYPMTLAYDAEFFKRKSTNSRDSLPLFLFLDGLLSGQITLLHIPVLIRPKSLESGRAWTPIDQLGFSSYTACLVGPKSKILSIPPL